jgi:beta-lactamase class A
MTNLVRLLWTDQAASPERCELGRQILLQQVWPHRLASGFPEDDFTTGGKTGTLPRVRNEAGIVLHADGSRYAVACFTTAESVSVKNPAADAVIGEAARIAVDALRS